MMSFPVIGQNDNAVDLNLARRVGENFIKMNPDIKLSGERGSLKRVETDKFPNLYIFNADEHGYVIVAGDKRVRPILAYSYNGSFNSNDMAPAVEMIVGGYDYVVDSIVRYNVRATDESIAQAWKNLENGYCERSGANSNLDIPLKIKPLIKTHWDQDSYNQLCPYTIDNNGNPNQFAVSGCDAVAMGQILYRYNIPKKTIPCPFYHNTETLYYTVKDQNGQYEQIASRLCPYNPSNSQCEEDPNISMNMNDLTIDWNYSLSEEELAPRIIRDCAFAAHAQFGINGTGIWPVSNCEYLGSVLDAFRNAFGFEYAEYYNVTQSSIENDKLTIRAHLAKKIPIFYGGENSTGGSHGYVIDAYEIRTDNETYFHANFGDGNEDPTYYSLNHPNMYNNNQGYILLYPERYDRYSAHITRRWGGGFERQVLTNNKKYIIKKGDVYSVTKNETKLLLLR